ncbi:MAG: hypothetical protein A3A04_02140 [Candidatus Harrisonbacteria bacterium RIFCSPLOWO2_01_FULL_40_28]|uniref:Uncharacterized protein n=2 Tax=Candidatus Harrisoniibacteriota TaxID=1817905 RepID=A0A1G1ZVK0_9BACT|nr:MAG: hypothetical protein A3A04_02140 [Candidatus Harrisonbacteria bacterium RIFCSPLOWO2_01_FULL_40_28]OGY68495.1 MAG: hypothetical protein A2586_02070 [Candidatus Harrisonbacteria bacterium RIFOXYD1_FULL_40_9]
MNKYSYTFFGIVVVVILAAVFMGKYKNKEASQSIDSASIVSDVDQELNGINLENLEAEFGDIDKELNDL